MGITIINDKPQFKNKKFLVDTNILFSINCGITDPSFVINKNKTNRFSKYIAHLVNNSNTLYTTTANIQEIINLIEKYEFSVYCAHNNFDSETFSKKIFRSLPEQRQRLETKLTAIYNEITSIYEILEVPIKMQYLDKLIKNYNKHHFDPIDYLIVECCIENGITNFITYDSDFQKDSRINVFTV